MGMTSINTVILKRCEESRINSLNHYPLDSSQRFRMTDKNNDVIGSEVKNSENSSQLSIIGHFSSYKPELASIYSNYNNH